MPQPLTDNDRSDIIAALSAALESVTSPNLVVVDGPTVTVNQDRECHFWYTGGQPTEEGSGLNDQSMVEHFTIAVYWRLPVNGAAYAGIVGECWNASRNIQSAIQVHDTLGGLVEIIRMGSAQAGTWVQASGLAYYALEIPIDLVCYGADVLGG